MKFEINRNETKKHVVKVGNVYSSGPLVNFIIVAIGTETYACIYGDGGSSVNNTLEGLENRIESGDVQFQGRANTLEFNY